MTPPLNVEPMMLLDYLAETRVLVKIPPAIRADVLRVAAALDYHVREWGPPRSPCLPADLAELRDLMSRRLYDKLGAERVHALLVDLDNADELVESSLDDPREDGLRNLVAEIVEALS